VDYAPEPAAPARKNQALFSCQSQGIQLYLLRVKPHYFYQVLFAAVALLWAGVSRGQCVIEGKVTLPKPQPATASPPRYPGQVGEIAPPDPPVAVVYLEGKFGGKPASSPPRTNQVAQSGMQFRPALLPVQVGTPVAFPNEDDFYHNVFSYSKTKRFDLGRYRKDDRPAPIIAFDKPGVVKLFCEIHQHMRGIILVLDTPYFTRTQTNGEYRLANLPSGKYVVKAWVDEKHQFEKPVSLDPGKPLRIDFDWK
jgi:plastocyanin